MALVSFWEMTWPLRRFLHATGQIRPTATQIVPFIVWFLTNCSLVLTTLLSVAHYVFEMGDASVPEIASTLVPLVHCIFYVCYIGYSKDSIFHLMAKCQRFRDSCTAFEKSEALMRKRAARRIRHIRFIYFGLIFQMIIGYILSPFLINKTQATSSSYTNPSIGDEYSVYFRIWLPGGSESMENNFIHAAVFVHQAFTCLVMAGIFSAVDCVLFSFVIYLDEAMQHILRIRPRALKPKLIDEISRFEKRTHTESECKILVKQHHFVIEVTMELEALLSPIVFISFIFHGALICTSTYAIFKTEDLRGRLFVLAQMTFFVVKLYASSYYGQVLIDQNKRLNIELPCKTWALVDEEEADDCHLLSLYCNMSLSLTASKFFNLSLEMFQAVCGIAVGYFFILLQFGTK